MFEFSVARKYLTPRWRQLSVSIISLISVLVIALVVWLIVVFFSVTYGLEKSWIGKLIALTAPIRITPTPAYYNSYYYLIDSVSEDSDYTAKTLAEKRHTSRTDPYDPQRDAEIPRTWPKPDLDAQGELKDPVKLAFHQVESLKGIQGLLARDYEMTVSNMHLNLYRKEDPSSHEVAVPNQFFHSTLTQAAYLGSYDPDNLDFSKALLPLSREDIANLHQQIPSSYSTAHPLWPYVSDAQLILPTHPVLGDGVLLPRSFRNAEVLVGDRGYLTYLTPSANALQEQQLPIYVAGFYDPGIISIGGRYILANQDLVSLIRSSHHQEDTSFSNGINVRFDDLQQADGIKADLQKKFLEAGIAPYWTIQTFREFDFTRDIIQQLGSEKNLFSLLAAIIIIVACSNIVSMLIILVNDKKLEIGIMRSMGATSLSIALIFGACGIFMGFAGSLIGVLAALLTLQNLQVLIDFISRLQGHDLFNPLFYGETLPTQMSLKTLGFVMLATAIVSLIAGLVPAIKATLLRPSAILRSE